MQENHVTTDNYNSILSLSEELISLARDVITVRFRFFDVALGRLKLMPRKGIGRVATEGDVCYYDPTFLLKEYMEEKGIVVRVYLHILLHSIFWHQFSAENLHTEYWDIATDIAVENIIFELGLGEASLGRDKEAMDIIDILKKRVPSFTAEKIYREFLLNEPSRDMLEKYRRFFTIDDHYLWRNKPVEELIIDKQEWEKITRRIQTELKAFSKEGAGSESLEGNLLDTTRERYDYKKILRRFTDMGEEMAVNDQEFDYVYYTYGLRIYGNMPLVEPLEYRETNKIKEFVIAIDTSASCRGELVRAFLNRTYEILSETESFFNHINVHIIQCDAEVKEDTKITSKEDFEHFMEKGKLVGFGATDFRPVFEYVEELRSTGEFTNLKGLIYFTDGYGVYPEKMPNYDVIFAFLNEDINRQPVPGWAIKVVMEDELYEYQSS